MKKQNEPSEASHSPQGKGISDLIRYYKIGTAAALLGCTTEALLHLGAIGKVEITAPIVAAAEFTWPVGNATIGFIEIDTPFVHYFDASSRVSLFPYDLAKIEAVGWTVPWRFYAPTYSRQVIKSAPRTFEESITERNKQRTARNEQVDRYLIALRKTIPDGNVISDTESEPSFPMPGPNDTHFFDEGLEQLHEAGFYSAWLQTQDPSADAPKTTLEHLFISKLEVDRLRANLPQENPLPESELGQSEPKRPHGGIERHAKPRLEALQVAVWLHRKAIKDVVKDGTKWAREVDARSREFWPPGSSPELELDTITKLLRSVLRDDCTNLFGS
jgi:hypothetical protein